METLQEKSMVHLVLAPEHYGILNGFLTLAYLQRFAMVIKHIDKKTKQVGYILSFPNNQKREETQQLLLTDLRHRFLPTQITEEKEPQVIKMEKENKQLVIITWTLQLLQEVERETQALLAGD